MTSSVDGGRSSIFVRVFPVTLAAGTDEEGIVTDRVLIQDVVPYELPSSLDELRGPGSGFLQLPQSVH